MTTFFGAQQRALQDQFETRQLADRVASVTRHTAIDDQDRAFIESRDLFFLSSVDEHGQPTCSYKGGDPGFVQALDSQTLAFPSYDGNGMFLSLGNIRATAKVGLLFIDFETPNRLRVHGLATVSADDPLRADFVGAELIVRVAVTELFVNCPRYIHRYQKHAPSRYLPQPDCAAPVAQWKRIDLLQDVLPARDQSGVAAAGGAITFDDYAAQAARGEG